MLLLLQPDPDLHWWWSPSYLCSCRSLHRALWCHWTLHLIPIVVMTFALCVPVCWLSLAASPHLVVWWYIVVACCCCYSRILYWLALMLVAPLPLLMQIFAPCLVVSLDFAPYSHCSPNLCILCTSVLVVTGCNYLHALVLKIMQSDCAILWDRYTIDCSSPTCKKYPRNYNNVNLSPLDWPAGRMHVWQSTSAAPSFRSDKYMFICVIFCSSGSTTVYWCVHVA